MSAKLTTYDKKLIALIQLPTTLQSSSLPIEGEG